MQLVLLIVTAPAAILLEYVFHAGPLPVFATSAVAIAVLANWIRRGTEQMAERVGPAVGGLLAISFGSVAELVLALFVRTAGRT